MFQVSFPILVLCSWTGFYHPLKREKHQSTHTTSAAFRHELSSICKHCNKNLTHFIKLHPKISKTCQLLKKKKKENWTWCFKAMSEKLGLPWYLKPCMNIVTALGLTHAEVLLEDQGLCGSKSKRGNSDSATWSSAIPWSKPPQLLQKTKQLKKW